MTWMDVLIHLVDHVFEIIFVVLMPVLTYQVKKKIDNDKAVNLFEQAERYLYDTVTMVKQTFVDSLKAEGKFDADAQKEAFDMAFDAWKQTMSEEMKTVVVNMVGDLHTWAAAKIESMVVETKK